MNHSSPTPTNSHHLLTPLMLEETIRSLSLGISPLHQQVGILKQDEGSTQYLIDQIQPPEFLCHVTQKLKEYAKEVLNLESPLFAPIHETVQLIQNSTFTSPKGQEAAQKIIDFYQTYIQTVCKSVGKERTYHLTGHAYLHGIGDIPFVIEQKTALELTSLDRHGHGTGAIKQIRNIRFERNFSSPSIECEVGSLDNASIEERSIPTQFFKIEGIFVKSVFTESNENHPLRQKLIDIWVRGCSIRAFFAVHSELRRNYPFGEKRLTQIVKAFHWVPRHLLECSESQKYLTNLEYHQQFLATQKAIYGNKAHPEIATSLNNLALAYDSLEEFSKAIECQSQALAMQQEIYGNKAHPDTAASLNNLGNAYLSLKKHSEAIKCYEQSLAMRKEIYGSKPHLDIATSLNNLGNAYYSLGELLKAIECHQQSLAMKGEIYGDEVHLDIDISLVNLAEAYESLGEISKAIEYFERSLAMRKKMYGSEPHPEIAIALHNLGSAYHSLEEFSKAIEYFEQSLVMKKELYGNKAHLDTVVSLIDLSNAYNSFGEYSKAIKYCEQGLAMQNELYSNKAHLDIAISLSNLGTVYNSLEEYSKAIEYFEQSLAMQKELNCSKPHPVTAASLNRLGDAYGALGETSKAIECYEQSQAFTKEILA